MSDPGPASGDPFKGMPFFGDIARMLQGQGPINWDAARQFSWSVATDGQMQEPNVEPTARIRLEELARIAEVHVTGATGLTVAAGGGMVTIAAVTPGAWAARSLDAYRPLFERLAGALGSGGPGSGTASGPGSSGAGLDPFGTSPAEFEGEEDAAAAMFAGLLSMLSPMMLGMAAGSMVGHLARRAFGQYDLPIPRPRSDELLLVPSAIDRFAADWSLPVDDVRLFVLVQELTTHAVLAVPHVRAELERMIGEYVAGFRPDPRALESRIESMDPSAMMSPTGLQQLFGDPQVLLGAMQSPEQEALLPRLDGLLAVVIGVVDHTLDLVGGRLMGSYPRLAEAVRRHRVESDASDVFVERLLGLSLGQDQVDRGKRFVDGIVERAGEDAVARLWRSGRELPTPAEVDAPGLWLARIDLPD